VLFYAGLLPIPSSVSPSPLPPPQKKKNRICANPMTQHGRGRVGTFPLVPIRGWLRYWLAMTNPPQVADIDLAIEHRYLTGQPWEDESRDRTENERRTDSDGNEMNYCVIETIYTAMAMKMKMNDIPPLSTPKDVSGVFFISELSFPHFFWSCGIQSICKSSFLFIRHLILSSRFQFFCFSLFHSFSSFFAWILHAVLDRGYT